MGDSPENMTLDNGTPIAGVFAGITYATAILSALLSQSLESKKQVIIHEGTKYYGHEDNEYHVVTFYTIKSVSLESLIEGLPDNY